MSMVEAVIPDSLMKQIRELAEREGVTVEQFISSAAAEKAAAWMTVEYLRTRVARGDRESFERALACVPDVEPEEVASSSSGLLTFSPDLTS